MSNSRPEILQHHGEANRTMCINRLSKETPEYSELTAGVSRSTVPEDFMVKVEKCTKDMNYARRKNEIIFMEFKKALRGEAERISLVMKESLTFMHEQSSKQFEEKLQEFIQVLTQVDKLFDEIRERTLQMDKLNASSVNSKSFLEESYLVKKRIETEVEKIISQLNKKRMKDESMLKDFRESVQEQAQKSIIYLEQALALSTQKSSTLMSKKCEELDKALQQLSKFT